MDGFKLNENPNIWRPAYFHTHLSSITKNSTLWPFLHKTGYSVQAEVLKMFIKIRRKKKNYNVPKFLQIPKNSISLKSERKNIHILCLGCSSLKFFFNFIKKNIFLYIIPNQRKYITKFNYLLLQNWKYLDKF